MYANRIVAAFAEKDDAIQYAHIVQKQNQDEPIRVFDETSEDYKIETDVTYVSTKET